MAEVIRLYEENPNERQLTKVVEALENGGLIIYPTDTVYALGCDVNNAKGIERMAWLRGIKPGDAQFSFVFDSISNLSDYVKQMDNQTFRILKRALPGPYTFVLEGNTRLPKHFRKRKTVGIRIPDSNIALEIIKRLGRPLVSTSIRDEDDILEYTTDPELIAEKWDKHVSVIVDGGYGDNVPSTVIDLTTPEPTLIREGKGALEI